MDFETMMQNVNYGPFCLRSLLSYKFLWQYLVKLGRIRQFRSSQRQSQGRLSEKPLSE